MIELSEIGFEETPCKLLSSFANEVRLEIVRFLLQSEMATLSEIRGKLTELQLERTAPGVFKHMKKLEQLGIVRRVSGGLVYPVPDARKKVYLLEGKERVEKILQQIESSIGNLLVAGLIFVVTSRYAQKIQDLGPKLTKVDERKRFESLLKMCKSPEVYYFLTEDEKKKISSWTAI